MASFEYEQFEPFDPAFQTRLGDLFGESPFITALGLEPVKIAPGKVFTELVTRRDHQQQNGFIHAGVLATVADHTAGGAASTLIFPDKIVLTAEFKINLLRPAKGEKVICESYVLKNGKTLIVADSYLYMFQAQRRRLVARATVTLAVV